MDLIETNIYDPADPAFQQALAQASTNPDLAQCFVDILRREEVDFTHHQRETARNAGACFSGMSSACFQVRPPQALLSEAEQRAALQAQFRATPSFTFLAAMSDARKKIEAAHRLLEQAQAAYSRGFPDNAEAARNFVHDAATAATEASMALDSAGGVAEQIRVAAYELTRRQPRSRLVRAL